MFRDLLDEIGGKKLVRTRVAVSGGGAPPLGSSVEHLVAPAVPIVLADDYRPAVDVIFGQLLGLFVSLRLSLQPDCPSPNGAITRVVQNVSIHS